MHGPRRFLDSRERRRLGGVIETAEGREVRSTRDCFEEAWKRALSEGVVTPEDAGSIQFRTTLSA
jgi:hypothetical protein